MKTSIFIFCALFCLVFINCARKSSNQLVMPQDSISYLALGDSYTIGESVSQSESFPFLLAEELKKKGKKIGAPTVIARTGWTTDELTTAIENANIHQQKYNLVTLLIGVNNQYRGRKIDEYKKEFITLVNKALVFANQDKNHVIIVSIPDWYYTPFGQNSNRNTTSAEIDAFNKVNKDVADSLSIPYVNITDITREGLKDTLLVANDGLHPSGKCYQKWAERIASVL